MRQQLRRTGGRGSKKVELQPHEEKLLEVLKRETPTPTQATSIMNPDEDIQLNNILNTENDLNDILLRRTTEVNRDEEERHLVAEERDSGAEETQVDHTATITSNQNITPTRRTSHNSRQRGHSAVLVSLLEKYDTLAKKQLELQGNIVESNNNLACALNNVTNDCTFGKKQCIMADN
ncbi:hypothetical protein ILUMI_02793 [Ignelater luminosus]|uniref:Uncharacterized protein n=1 Tax=Ignelater luminosus TaxID=2038154 RepID=A0A8K0DH04_IGNLU|nr:hypothetical protein ILUMI_02793 [Ignelater luminosus]